MKLHMHHMTPWSVLISALFIMLMTFSFSSQASAHGYVSQPESRALLCKQGDNKNCGRIIYEPQSLEAPGNFPIGGPADGKIASANTFFELDAQTRLRWQKVAMKNGMNQFKWKFTAPHVTGSWEYYITRTGWDTNQPLKRADLQKFCTVDGKKQRPPSEVTHTCNVPERTGYHVILAVWNIGDTKNAFYNVIDADFGGKQAIPTEPDKNIDMTPIIPSKPLPETKPEKPVQPKPDLDRPAPPAVKWDEGKVYVEGDQAQFESSLYEAQWWTRGDLPGDSAVWKLLEPANTDLRNWKMKNVYTVGNQVVHEGIVYEAQWWTSGDTPGKKDVWKFIKIINANVKKWEKKLVYLVGNQVIYENSLYEAQWWTRGDLPGDSAVWKLVKSAATGVPQWRTANVYVAGDQVIYNGNLYEAKWWTRANVPSDSEQWKRK
ncbi:MULTISPECIES: lytic polysaccharide monooxygenase [unclassified Sporosarcina]|uniref:lytic polysaccharide monooxygenase n=1 Tax=unclassified Sporosarcina TaxID=2647733 RepID=UPI000C584B96|nr:MULTISPECIES: lytic polysaccharide monooxygenase [unclassified Sporosarcina]PID05081.1 chitin-binding protein [Sporosarcina sp. P30]PID08279.1 chitin-binding protein [Sporosarcina sp. P31]PID11358.1 chitin-binding protein [Sporosarcina sp. P32b]